MAIEQVSALRPTPLDHNDEGADDDVVAHRQAAWDRLNDSEKTGLRQREAARLFSVASDQQQLAEFDDAARTYARVVALNPNFPEAYNNLGVVLRQLGRREAALACYRRTIALNPRMASAFTNLGNVLRELGDLDAALDSHRRAAALAPKEPMAYHNLGLVLRDKGALNGAQKAFTSALKREPDHLPSLLDQARIALLKQDWTNGFQGLEARFRLPTYPHRRFDQPVWDGTALKGKTVLVHGEGSPADMILMARYLPRIKQRGGNLVVEVPRALADLVSGMPGVDKVILQGAHLPRFDFHLPMLSLATTTSDAGDAAPPTAPYLKVPDPGRARLSAKAADSGLRVGLVWGDDGIGAPAARPDPGLAAFLELTGTVGAQFFSLQRGEPATELIQMGSEALIADIARGRESLGDLAADIARLDLVIAADSAVAHLAAAMGKPVWLVAHPVGAWCWGADGEGSPFYPSMTVCRVGADRDWRTLLRRLRRDLKEFDPASA